MQMLNSCTQIGILGGTFNPIHNGHLAIAESVRQAYGLDKILFIPSGLPPHKMQEEVEHAQHRLAMVRCATSENPFFEVSDMEIDRHGYSYTIDTLRQLKEIYGKNCTINFIIGADIIPELITWKDFARVFSLCEFIAVMRPGHTREEFDREIEWLKAKYNAIIKRADVPLLDISSTQIRELVKLHKPITQLVPACVERYIKSNCLYL